MHCVDDFLEKKNLKTLDIFFSLAFGLPYCCVLCTRCQDEDIEDII